MIVAFFGDSVCRTCDFEILMLKGVNLMKEGSISEPGVRPATHRRLFEFADGQELMGPKEVFRLIRRSGEHIV